MCDAGRKVDLLVEASKTNEKILEECRIRLGPTLQASGLSDTTSQVKQDDPAITAAIKQQASLDLDKKRFADQVNAFRQREAASQRKIQVLKDNHAKKQHVNNKFGKGWKGSSKGHGKGLSPNHVNAAVRAMLNGETQDHHKKQQKSHNKGKGKSKQWNKRWDQKW